jgi:hypothetical protein
VRGGQELQTPFRRRQPGTQRLASFPLRPARIHGVGEADVAIGHRQIRRQVQEVRVVALHLDIAFLPLAFHPRNHGGLARILRGTRVDSGPLDEAGPVEPALFLPQDPRALGGGRRSRGEQGERDEQRGIVVRVASSLALLSARPPDADALGSVPIPNLPTVGLVDSLDTCVDDSSARCAVRRGDDFPFARLVGEAVADPKLHRENLGVAHPLRFALLGAARACRAR